MKRLLLLAFLPLLLGATVEDNFNDDLSLDDWIECDGDLTVTAFTTDELSVLGAGWHVGTYTTSGDLGTVEQWGYIQVGSVSNSGHSHGLGLRMSATTCEGYVFTVSASDGDVHWYHYADSGDTWSEIQQLAGSFAVGSNNWLACRVTGTGASTDAKCYELSATPPDYDGYDDTWALDANHVATFTFTADCTTGSLCSDSNQYAGAGMNDSGSSEPKVDNFKAGSISAAAATGNIPGVTLTGVSVP